MYGHDYYNDNDDMKYMMAQWLEACNGTQEQLQ